VTGFVSEQRYFTLPTGPASLILALISETVFFGSDGLLDI
jgi:hypothetical protein